MSGVITDFLKHTMERIKLLYKNSEGKTRTPRRVLMSIKYLLFLLVLVYFLKVIFQIKDKIIIHIFNVNLSFVEIGILCIFFSFIIYTILWYLTLSFIGKILPFPTLFEINIISLFLRYLPGGVGDHIGRYAMLSRMGVEKKTIAFSLALLVGMLVFGGILFFFTFSPFYLSRSLRGIFNTPFLLGILVFLFILFAPKIIKHTMNTSSFGYRKIIFLLLLSILHWIIWGSGAFYTVKAFHPLSCNLWLKVVSIATVSWVIGFLTPFAPNGIGVRELVFVFLLKDIVPYSIAVSASIFFRGVTAASDILCGILLLIIYFFKIAKRTLL